MSAQGWEDAFNVVLGAVLALASSGGAGWLKGRQRDREMRAAIRKELRETAYRLLAFVFTVGRRHGMFDRELLMWMKEELERYSGSNPSQNVLAAVNALLAQRDDTLATMRAHLQSTTLPQHVPREDPAYTNASVASLHNLGEDYASRVLDVLAHLRMFNEARDYAEFYMRVTFTPGLSGDDQDSAQAGIDNSEKSMLNRAKVVVGKISLIEDLYPAPKSILDTFLRR